MRRSVVIRGCGEVLCILAPRFRRPQDDRRFLLAALALAPLSACHQTPATDPGVVAHGTPAAAARPTVKAPPPPAEDVVKARVWLRGMREELDAHPPFAGDPQELVQQHQNVDLALRKAEAANEHGDLVTLVRMTPANYELSTSYAQAWMNAHPLGVAKKAEIAIILNVLSSWLPGAHPPRPTPSFETPLHDVQAELEQARLLLDQDDLGGAERHLVAARQHHDAYEHLVAEYQQARKPLSGDALIARQKQANASCREDTASCQQECDEDGIYACAALAGMYFDGDGVDQDRIKAIEFDRRACRGRNQVACMMLQTLEEKTRACAPLADCIELCAWSGAACFAAGDAYFTGQGARPDAAKALPYFRKSCELGYGPGCRASAFAYGSGRGTPRSWQQAVHYYQVACDAHGVVDDHDTCQEAENTQCMAKTLVSKQRRSGDDAKCNSSRLARARKHYKAYESADEDMIDRCLEPMREAAGCYVMRIHEPQPRAVFCCSE